MNRLISYYSGLKFVTDIIELIKEYYVVIENYFPVLIADNNNN